MRAAPARASVGYVPDGKAAGVIVGLVAVGVVIGFGIYYVVHKRHTLKGCVSGSGSGMELRSEGDGRVYMLDGDVSAVHGGERVRVNGRRKSLGPGGAGFEVSQLEKDYGACQVAKP